MKTGIKLIARERKEQIKKHGITIEKDAKGNNNKQLAEGAYGLLETEFVLGQTPDDYALSMPSGWDQDLWFKMGNKSYKKRLIIAGALIAAELDRLNFNEV